MYFCSSEALSEIRKFSCCEKRLWSLVTNQNFLSSLLNCPGKLHILNAWSPSGWRQKECAVFCFSVSAPCPVTSWGTRGTAPCSVLGLFNGIHSVEVFEVTMSQYCKLWESTSSFHWRKILVMRFAITKLKNFQVALPLISRTKRKLMYFRGSKNKRMTK